MPGRNPNAGSNYRYGFNGKEKDGETYGDGNEYDYGMRIYDPRLGRFMSVDPLKDEFPWNSVYAFAENDVIRCVDLDGEEKSMRFIQQNSDGSYTVIKEISWDVLYPGQKQGDKGSGTLDRYYDKKTGHFNEGIYVKSWEDEHPFAAMFKKVDNRYEGAKGVRTLVNDAKNAATKTKLGGVIIMGVGAVSGNPIIVGYGLTVYEVADKIDNAATVVDAVVDYGEGKKVEAVIKVASVAADEATGKAVGDIANPAKKELKEMAYDEIAPQAAGNVATDQIINVISDETTEQITSEKF